ncbi:MAG: ABC transporter ATP-binding protein [Vampirovibrionia bacterium]
MTQNTEHLIKIENLYKHFPIKKGFFNKTIGHVQAITDLNLNIVKGETLGLVGESGCGKSTTGRCILKLLQPSSGHIYYEDKNINQLNNKELHHLRRKMQIIFQNPYSSLDPRMTVRQIITEPLIIHKTEEKNQIDKRLTELLDMVGIATSMLERYPHEFSGGQRQRIGIARALALNPSFIVADEPVSALDVSIQAQIINLLLDLKKELNLTYLFIAHNLSVVQYVSDRVAVMYLGEIVELAPAKELYKNPKHPYTEALLSAIPIANPGLDRSNRILLEGDVPSPDNPPSGCKFHTRCIYSKDDCKNILPELEEKSSGHFTRCLYSDKLSLKSY